MSHGKQSELYTSDFGDQLAFTVGCSYMFGFLGGLAGGIVNGVPKSWRMPKKLIMNNFFNSVGKETSRIGNGFAAAGFMYVGVGIVLNAVFQDQLDQLTSFQKNILCGGITGAVYKSTRGFVPAVVGGLVGTTIIAGLTTLVEEGNRRGYLAFEMKY